MRVAKIRWAVLVCVAASPAWAAGPGVSDGVRRGPLSVREMEAAPQGAAIRAARERFNRAIADRDAEAIGAFLAREYQSLSSRNARARGREESVRRWASMFSGDVNETYTRTPREIRLFEAWGMAEELGDWEGKRRVRGEEVRVAGRYAAKWVHEDGAWRLLSEVFTALECDGPAEACAAP